MKRLVKTALIVIGILLLGLLVALVPPNLSSIRPGITIQQEHYDSLISLQEMAAQMGEYPVSTLVLYKENIIGAGFNSFRNLNEPLGHAEINAIENVFEGMHYFEFRELSRDSLVLISSYEPCPMCKGVLNHLDIRKVYYLKPKKLSYRVKYLRKEFSYNFKTRRIKAPEDQ